MAKLPTSRLLLGAKTGRKLFTHGLLEKILWLFKHIYPFNAFNCPFPQEISINLPASHVYDSRLKIRDFFASLPDSFGPGAFHVSFWLSTWASCSQRIPIWKTGISDSFHATNPMIHQIFHGFSMCSCGLFDVTLCFPTGKLTICFWLLSSKSEFLHLLSPTDSWMSHRL